MSEQFHLWYFLKDFLVLNVKQYNYILPYELVRYIYCYAISDEFKIDMNKRCIEYALKKKIENNRKWLSSSLVFNKFLDGKKENICIPVGCKYWKRYKQVTRLCNTHEDIILCQEDLPYKSIITDIDAFHTIWAYLDKYNYSHIKYTINGIFYASGYTNREEVSDSVDHLNIKIFSINKRCFKKAVCANA